jgi:hypothetical protein
VLSYLFSEQSFEARCWVLNLSSNSLLIMRMLPVLFILPWVTQPFCTLATNVLAPRIEFASTAFEFGRVQAGQPVKHDFTFTNTGKALLEILDVKPGCGCTTAGEWTRHIEPGKTGSIPLQFNSAAFAGDVDKTATVTCNDPERTNVVLELKGTVWRPIEVVPSMVLFQVTEELKTKLTKTVEITNHLDEPLALWSAESPSASFEAVLKTNQPGKAYELEVTAIPPFTAQYAAGVITLRTSASETPIITIQAAATLLPLLAITPSQIAVPAGPLEDSLNAFVTVRNNGTNKLTLSEARVDAPGVEVQLEEGEPGRYFILALKFKAGFQIPSGKEVAVSVKSDNPRFGLIRIPILADQTAQAVARKP